MTTHYGCFLDTCDEHILITKFDCSERKQCFLVDDLCNSDIVDTFKNTELSAVQASVMLQYMLQHDQTCLH